MYILATKKHAFLHSLQNIVGHPVIGIIHVISGEVRQGGGGKARCTLLTQPNTYAVLWWRTPIAGKCTTQHKPGGTMYIIRQEDDK